MKKNKKNLSKAEIFKKTFKGYLADRTLEEYSKVVNQIENETLTITSKSRYLIVKAVLAKCNQAGIEVDYKLMPFKKRGDEFHKNVISKLVSEAELEKILDNLPNSPKGKQLKTACEIAYYSGLRLKETLNLKPENISIDRSIRLNVTGKGNKYRSTYLPQKMRQELEIFEGFDINVNYVEKTLNRISDKIGIKFSFHSLRHSFATNMLEKGVPVHKVQKLLGHSNLQVTARYLHALEELDENMRAIGY